MNLSQVYNQLANIACYGGVFGGIGCLAGRVVGQINPYAGLVCGGAAGVTTALCFKEEDDLVKKVIGAAFLIFAPLKICELLQLPVTLKACFAITGLTTALAIFTQILHQKYMNAQEENKSEQFDIEHEEMEEEFKKEERSIENENQQIEENTEQAVEAEASFIKEEKQKMPNNLIAQMHKELKEKTKHKLLESEKMSQQIAEKIKKTVKAEVPLIKAGEKKEGEKKIPAFDNKQKKQIDFENLQGELKGKIKQKLESETNLPHYIVKTIKKEAPLQDKSKVPTSKKQNTQIDFGKMQTELHEKIKSKHEDFGKGPAPITAEIKKNSQQNKDKTTNQRAQMKAKIENHKTQIKTQTELMKKS